AALAEARERVDQRFALSERRRVELPLDAGGRVDALRKPRRAALSALDQHRDRCAVLGRVALALEPVADVRAQRCNARLDGRIVGFGRRALALGELLERGGPRMTADAGLRCD